MRTARKSRRFKCARCNQGKEAPGWRHRVERDDGGRVVQVSTPLGHRYVSEPPPLLAGAARPARIRGWVDRAGRCPEHAPRAARPAPTAETEPRAAKVNGPTDPRAEDADGARRLASPRPGAAARSVRCGDARRSATRLHDATPDQPPRTRAAPLPDLTGTRARPRRFPPDHRHLERDFTRCRPATGASRCHEE